MDTVTSSSSILNQQWEIKNDEIHFDSYQGELGWECCTIAPYYRYVAQNYKKAHITSFCGMGALYEDFAEFKSHDSDNRTLNYPKKYRLHQEAIYKKYGQANSHFDILIHNRGINRKASINFNRWEKIIKHFTGLKIASIGTLKDRHVPGTIDRRDMDLHDLMNYMAGCKCVVGVSSGVMHLAAFCGAPLVVWGDNRTYYWETLETRYKITWNPFGNKVFYIKTQNFQPNINTIIKGVFSFV